MSKKLDEKLKPYETMVVDDIMSEFKANKSYSKLFNIERENTQVKYLSMLLATASKENNGKRGKCDIMLTPKHEKTATYILVECKRYSTQHGTLRDDESHKGKAVPEAAHYVKHVWEKDKRSNGHTIIGVAVSGTKPDRKITVIGICNCQNNVSDPYVKELYDGIDIPDYDVLLNKLYAFDNVPGVKSIVGTNNVIICTIPLSVLHRIDLSTAVQRYYSISHKKEILVALSELHTNNKCIILPGAIIIVICDYKYYIVDGQHRFEAYKEFYQRHKHDENILFQIFTVETLNEVKDMYETHYKAMAPMQEEKVITVKIKKEKKDNVNSSTKNNITNRWSLSDEIIESSSSSEGIINRGWHYELTNKVFDLISQEWDIVNDSTAPPNITRNTQMEYFQQYLVENEKSYCNTSPESIMKILMKKNKELINYPPTKQKSNPKKEYGDLTYQKAYKCGCYLGLIWADEWLQ